MFLIKLNNLITNRIFKYFLELITTEDVKPVKAVASASLNSNEQPSSTTNSETVSLTQINIYIYIFNYLCKKKINKMV